MFFGVGVNRGERMEMHGSLGGGFGGLSWPKAATSARLVGGAGCGDCGQVMIWSGEK